jgi:RNA polymerase sigma-70 factor (ECF subfamily)
VSVTAARFDQAVQANGADLHAYLARRLGAVDAGDALGEVYATAWRRRLQLPEDGTEVRMWLFGVAANVVRNAQRGHQRRRSLLDRMRHQADVGVDARSDADDLTDAVQAAIARLPPAQAELVRLRHWDGFTLQEAATILGIPASTARSRYAAAREQLRQLLSALTPY